MDVTNKARRWVQPWTVDLSCLSAAPTPPVGPQCTGGRPWTITYLPLSRDWARLSPTVSVFMYIYHQHSVCDPFVFQWAVARQPLIHFPTAYPYHTIAIGPSVILVYSLSHYCYHCKGRLVFLYVSNNCMPALLCSMNLSK